MRRLALPFLLVPIVTAAASAQNSVYGVRGVGFPGHPWSIRARALGGGWAAFDRFSTLNPATAAQFTALSVSATYGATLRRYRINDIDVAGLVESRFPHAVLGGSIGRWPVAFAMSVSTYAERSFDVSTTGTILVDATPVEVADRLISNGGIVDARAALGYRPGPRLAMGAALHIINGSSRLSATREFVDSDLETFDERADLSFSGIGISGGLQWLAPGGRFQLASSVRWDHELTATVDNSTSTVVDLPLTVAGGVSVVVTPILRWSTTGTWRNWSVADADLPDVTAFNTWGVGSGLEVGRPTTRFPMRVGVRYARLPFSTSGQPREFGLSVGTGSRFAAGRGELNISVERLFRDGAGASERGWHIAVGITVTP